MLLHFMSPMVAKLYGVPSTYLLFGRGVITFYF